MFLICSDILIILIFYIIDMLRGKSFHYQETKSSKDYLTKKTKKWILKKIRFFYAEKFSLQHLCCIIYTLILL